MSDERRDARLVDAIERPGQDPELERDARALRAVLAQARDALPLEEPPTTLDARILAAARIAADEARARQASTGWRRWLRSPALGLALAGGMAAIVAVVIDPAALRAPATEPATLRNAPPPAPTAQSASAEEPAAARARAAAPREPTAGDAPSASGVGRLAAEEGAEPQRTRRDELAEPGPVGGGATPRAPKTERAAPVDERLDDERSSRESAAAKDTGMVAMRDEDPAATLDRAAVAKAKKAIAHPPKEEELAAKDAWGLVGDGARIVAQPQPAAARDDEADGERPPPPSAPRAEDARAKRKANESAVAGGSASAGAGGVGVTDAAPFLAPSASPPRRPSSEPNIAALPAPSDAAVAALLAEAAREASAGRSEQAAATLETAAREARREPDRGLVALRRAELALATGRPAEAQVHAQVASRSPSPAVVARARVLSARARAAAP